jgi:hypothetical protein
MTQPGSGTGFQTFVNNLPPPAVAGDFAGANIRANVIASLNGFVATPAGVVVGRGAWADPTYGLASNYYRTSSFMGFVHRNMQALITAYLANNGSTIQSGDPVTVMDQGEFWGFFASSASVGQKVYFDPVTGALTANSTGQSVTASNTSVTISGGNALSLVGTTTGTVAIGQLVVMAGLPNGTYITAGSGTSWTIANADGTTIPNISTTAASFYGVQESQFFVASPVTADASFTASLAVPTAPSNFGVLNVSAIASGVLAAGQWLSATGLPASANVQILEQLTGTAGSTGTYLTNNVAYTISSTSSFAATQGKLGKISSWV